MTEDNVVDLNTEILINIREEMRAMRTELKAEIGSVRAVVQTLEQETIHGFAGVRRELTLVNERLDHFIGVASGGHRDLHQNHEQRITALEAEVRRPRAGSRRRSPER